MAYGKAHHLALPNIEYVLRTILFGLVYRARLTSLSSAKIRSRRWKGTQVPVESGVADVHHTVCLFSYRPRDRERFPREAAHIVPETQHEATPGNVSGDINLTSWSDCRGQIDMLRTDSTAHPAFDIKLVAP
jgi:hypothetical protein